MDKPIVHPNFAHPSSKNASPSPTSPTSASTTATTQPLKPTSTSAIQYDHETYLELLAGESNHVEKTASQIYEEERARELRLRAQDPAVLSGPLELDVDVYRFGYADGDACGFKK